METKLIKSKQPTCKTCGFKMKEWNPFADEHEHAECISSRISEGLIKILRKQLNKTFKS